MYDKEPQWTTEQTLQCDDDEMMVMLRCIPAEPPKQSFIIMLCFCNMNKLE